MTKTKLLSVVKNYERLLEELNFSDLIACYHDRPKNEKQMLEHLKEMIPKMRQLIEEDELEKVFRWLGFMQGVLWSTGKYSLEELRDHNRS